MSNYNFETEKIKPAEKIQQVQKTVEDDKEFLLKSKKYSSPQEIQIHENMYPYYRRSGRTTRLVDAAIQKLFSNMGVKMYFTDHYNSIQSDILLQQKIIKRLEKEHPNVSVTYDAERYISIQERNKTTADDLKS